MKMELPGLHWRNIAILWNIAFLMLGGILLYQAFLPTQGNDITAFPATMAMLGIGSMMLLTGLVGLVVCSVDNFRLVHAGMIILFLAELFLCCISLYSTEGTLHMELASMWTAASTEEKQLLQTKFDCCGFDIQPQFGSVATHPPCAQSVCCLGSEAGCCHGNVSLPDASCPCSVCYPMLEKHSFESLKDSASTTAVFVVAMFFIIAVATATVMLRLEGRVAPSMSINGQTDFPKLNSFSPLKPHIFNEKFQL